LCISWWKNFDSYQDARYVRENYQAQQARLCNIYMNTKLKLLRTNAAIWFNKMCKIKHLKPNYINIKVNGNMSQDKKTTTNEINYRINQEIKLSSLH
jgi:hypothetical protein